MNHSHHMSMNHSHHMWLCAVFGGLAVLLVIVGAGAWALIPAAGCAVVCGQMVWHMISAGRKPSSQT
jgi:hypothetical protein